MGKQVGKQVGKQAEFAVILKMNPMFAELGTEELQRISNLCHTQQLAAGEMLFQKGDSGDALFGVRRGQIRIETSASDGSRLTLNFLGPGDLFGEVAVLDGQARTADATAAEPSELFVLRREDFLAHLEREPHVAGIAGLWVPQTGIVDYAVVARKYAELIRAAGGVIVTGARVTRVRRHAGEILLATTAGDVVASCLVNCGGLQSDRIARLCIAPHGKDHLALVLR